MWNRIFSFVEGYALDFMYFGYEHDTDPRRNPRSLDSGESCVPQFRSEMGKIFKSNFGYQMKVKRIIRHSFVNHS